MNPIFDAKTLLGSQNSLEFNRQNLLECKYISYIYMKGTSIIPFKIHGTLPTKPLSRSGQTVKHFTSIIKFYYLHILFGEGLFLEKNPFYRNLHFPLVVRYGKWILCVNAIKFKDRPSFRSLASDSSPTSSLLYDGKTSQLWLFLHSDNVILSKIPNLKIWMDRNVAFPCITRTSYFAQQLAASSYHKAWLINWCEW